MWYMCMLSAKCVEDSSLKKTLIIDRCACVLPHAVSQIHSWKTQKSILRGGYIAYLAYIAKCAVSGLSRLS